MPDHFHGIIILEQDDERRAIRELPLQRRDMLLPKIIGRFKMTSAKETIKNYISSIKGKTVLVVSHEWSNKNDHDKRDGFDRILVMEPCHEKVMN